MNGAFGTVYGVADRPGVGLELPALFFAVTDTVYVFPLVNPVMIYGVDNVFPK